MSFRRQAIVVALVSSVFASGCTRTITKRAARFEVAGNHVGATTQPVKLPGVWKVKVRGHGEDDYHGIDGTERYLQAGDVVGFRTGDDGVIYAVANEEEFPLPVTREHRRVIWAASVEEPTDFGRGMGDTLAVTGEVAVGAAVLGLVGAMWWLSVTADDDDDCDDRFSKRRNKRH